MMQNRSLLLLLLMFLLFRFNAALLVDVWIKSVDAKSNPSEKDPAAKVLAAHERSEKKKKCLEACLKQHWQDALLSKEARVLLKKLSALLAAKMHDSMNDNHNFLPMSAPVCLMSAKLVTCHPTPSC